MSNDQVATVAADYLSRLPNSPDIYCQGIDLIHQALLLVQFDAAAYRAASFLDDRILTPKVRGVWAPIPRVAAAARAVQNLRPLHFIFHTGHVGSTLVSRLLDETGVVLPLREPLPLRVLASAHDALGNADSLLNEAQFGALLGLFGMLWSRGYGDSRAVVLKATSSAGRLAAPLLMRRDDARAICLNLRAEPFLATLLAGPNSPSDLRGHGAERMRRMMKILAIEQPTPLHALSLGELAAMSWLTETATQHQTLQRFADRVTHFDFDAVLGDVAGSMARVTAHFGLPVDEKYLSQVAHSPSLTRYAKAPEHAYTPDLRAQILSEARRTHAAEIRKGLAWLEGVARTNAMAAAVMQANA
jgi:hypothetical protein